MRPLGPARSALSWTQRCPLLSIASSWRRLLPWLPGDVKPAGVLPCSNAAWMPGLHGWSKPGSDKVYQGKDSWVPWELRFLNSHLNEAKIQL